MNKLAERIAAEIKIRGVISFARFMELALYCPDYGFYEKEKDTIGRKGNFYTSVSVGDLFGQLLAFQFAEWLDEIEEDDEEAGGAAEEIEIAANRRNRHKRQTTERQERKQIAAQRSLSNPTRDKLQLVEAGAHNGQLATDILSWFRQFRPDLFGRLDYIILEASQRRRQWQAKTLAGFPGKVHWADGFSELGEVNGVIFSNELFDALPAHRVRWDARRSDWVEWGVGLDGAAFVWMPMEDGSIRSRRGDEADSLGFDCLDLSLGGTTGETRQPARQSASLPRRLRANWLAELAPALLEVLPDGFTTEICPQAERWWQEAAQALRLGNLLTIDYGFRIEELLRPERKDGTLRAYRNHHVTTEVLANPGEQDLTAHVNFSALEKAGLRAGLRTEIFQNQSRFLTGILSRMRGHERGIAQWNAKLTSQFQTLTNPEHLGQSFRVLVQRRAANGQAHAILA